MSKANLRAGTSPFAHLLANITGRSASRRAEDEREENQSAEDEHDDAEDGDDEPTDGKKGKKARSKRAEDDDGGDDADDDGDDEPDAEDEDDDDSTEDEDGDADKPEKGKRGKRAEDDDAKEAKGRRAGVATERQRWAKVLGHKHAGAGRIAAACNMLATTDMSASAVISTLGTLPSQEARGPGLRDRMSGYKQPDVGASGGRTGAPSLASQIIAAGKKRRGEA